MLIATVLIVAAVLILLIWIVPLRRRGIRGIGARKPKLSAILSESAAEDERLRRPHPGGGPTQAGRRPSGQDTGGQAGDRKGPGRPAGPDGRVLSELDKTWEPGYADRIEALHRSRKPLRRPDGE